MTPNQRIHKHTWFPPYPAGIKVLGVRSLDSQSPHLGRPPACFMRHCSPRTFPPTDIQVARYLTRCRLSDDFRPDLLSNKDSNTTLTFAFSKHLASLLRAPSVSGQSPRHQTRALAAFLLCQVRRIARFLALESLPESAFAKFLNIQLLRRTTHRICRRATHRICR